VRIVNFRHYLKFNYNAVIMNQVQAMLIYCSLLLMVGVLSLTRVLEVERSEPFLLRFRYKVRVPTPLTLTNYSGHITNAVVKKMLQVDDPLQHLVQVTPLADGFEERYIVKAPTAIPPGFYSFTVTTPFKEINQITGLVQQTHVELEGVKCQVEGVEFQPIGIQNLVSDAYPEFFYLIFRTPTRMGKKPLSLMAGKTVYELLPTPNYVFGTLAAIWNRVVPGEEMKIDVRKYLEWVRSHVIVVPQYRLMTYTVRLGGQREIPGFVGKIGYSSIKPRSYEHAITVILARLSHYTGTGVGRRLGLGVTAYREHINQLEER